jgi:DNA-binding NarL/FixJ family response regulator
MVRTTLIFGLCLAALLILMKWIEYSFFIRDISLEVYLGLVGIICLVLGVWMGKRFRDRIEDEGPQPSLINRVQPPPPFNAQNAFNLTPREFEVLVKIAEGHSYQEIADQLHVSLSTIKTHAAKLFSKMDVQRRTQAVMVAQQKGLLTPPNG